VSTDPRERLDRSRDPLVAVARAFLEGRPLRHAMRAVAALDWDSTIARAEQERLAPILYVALRGGAAPAPVLGRLRAVWMAADKQHLVAAAQLHELVGAFGVAGIETVILNGPALAADYYADPALRPFMDLDLLVRRGDRQRALDVLLGLGYTLDSPGRSLEHVPAAFLTPPSGSSRLPVDLHWECVEHSEGSRAAELATEEIWCRAVPAPSWGEAARTLAAEDLLIYLAASFAIHHTLAGALWQLDLALVLKRHRAMLDWDAVAARARRWGAAGAAYFALRAVGDDLGVTAPTPTMNRLRPGELRVTLIDRLQRAGHDGLLRLDYFVGVLMLDRYSDIVRLLVSGLVPPPGWLRSRYDSRSLLAAYLTHYGRMARTLARAMLM
jgi:hypothetical protein